MLNKTNPDETLGKNENIGGLINTRGFYEKRSAGVAHVSCPIWYLAAGVGGSFPNLTLTANSSWAHTVIVNL